MDIPPEFRLDDYDYDLPDSFIAQHPEDQRDESRLMIVSSPERLEHRTFNEIKTILEPGDVLVVNETKVSAFHLDGIKADSGIDVHCLFTECVNPQNNEYEVLAKPLRRLKMGTKLIFSEKLHGLVTHKVPASCRMRLFSPGGEGEVENLIKDHARPALPPYIKRSSEDDHTSDWLRYQTVYAQKSGSIAAPTAGLHFSRELLESLVKKGIIVQKINLRIGIGTFRPVRVDDVREHQMEQEYFEIPERVLEAIELCQREKRRLFAVGTTVIRALESGFSVESDADKNRSGKTGLFIYPGYRFRFDYHGMITNFHLPRSTLLLLVSAFAGKDTIKRAYREALERQYRFYSYGDAMLLLKEGKVL